METNNFYEQVWEYLLVIKPPDEVNNSIGKIKKEVGIKYGNLSSFNSSSYISLIKFALIKGYERNLLSLLFSFCINALPFEIVLNNYGLFPYHTLYAGVRESEGLKNLQNALISMLRRSFPFHEKYMHVNKKHHLTIAGNLNPRQFNSIAGEYRNRHINTSFKANNIVMLKQPYDEYKAVSYRWRGSHNFIIGCL